MESCTIAGRRISKVAGEGWWFFTCVVFGVTGVIATIWFLWGGFRDLKYLFDDLRNAVRDERDDGTVIDHHNLADEPTTEK
ncbi:MAG TPA: hypothetical protein DD726_02165 [Phycisphaerales bacterium]|nr:hypothetical protein [Phycisphaerales bacterium]